jgi:hypothetical protein
LKGGAFIATTSATAKLCETMMHLVMLCYPRMFVFSMLLCLVCILLSLTFCRRLMMGWSQGRLQFKKVRIMRKSPRWIRARHILPHATSRLQFSCHVRFGFSQHPCTVSVISPSSGIKTRRIRMCWNGDDDTVILVPLPAREGSWIMLCDHDKLLHHVFGQFGRVSCRALSPG